MEKPTPEKIEKVKKMIPEYTKFCSYYIRPILFGELPLKSLESTVKGATVAFVDTGKKAFGITALHVYKEYLKLKNEIKDFQCKIDNLDIDLESRLLDYSNEESNLDLITFEILPHEFEILDAKPLYHKPWPVKYQERGDSEPIFILGYPEHLREIESTEHIIAVAGSLMLTVKSVTDRRLYIELVRDGWIIHFSLKEIDLSKFRGISGAGVFRMNSLTPELLGIVTDHGENFFDVLFCSRADQILSNGKIIKV